MQRLADRDNPGYDQRQALVRAGQHVWSRSYNSSATLSGGKARFSGSTGLPGRQRFGMEVARGGRIYPLYRDPISSPRHSLDLLLHSRQRMSKRIGDPLSAEAPRLLVLAPQPFLADRGTPIALRQVLKALGELGVVSDVVTYPIGRDPDLPCVRILRAANPFGIRAVPVGFSLRKIVLDLSMAAKARRALKNGRYIAIQASEEAAFLAVILGRGRRLPIIYDMQSSLPEHLAEHRIFRLPPVRWLLERCERWLMNRADMIITSAGLGAYAAGLAPHTPVREWEFHAPNDPVAPEEVESLRARLAIPAGVRVVLYTGTFVPYQGLATLLDAVPRVLEAVPDAVFVLVGAEKTLAELFPGVDVPAAAVRVVDRQPRREMRRYYALADLVVSPRATGRNLPLKVFDYLGAGKAIVATDVHAHRAVLNDDLALLVPPTSDALADGIRLLLEDEGLRRRYAEAAAAFARERLGWEPFVRTLSANYGAILGRETRDVLS
jgi:glycosyltransferase involved in cell wall biosynthesis